ncbi:hypothetical protein [Roseisolibacter sp. H3M3-2]|uniref:hypothetical protein n=1 Tax=Roseisolibacter sp. H3M3-2 TaxID=3031323 RepID=UPI0023D9DBD7|nr:hypothetical protein [Roseisolibacter sp. H3M3-2]MDF1501349.1 hypothetical protein [Roseisolibacter sp. H3M3-2]
MRTAHIGRLLLLIGLLVGAAASVGLLVGFEPARLPPTLLNVAAYKLTFIAALGLLAGGAVFLRLSRRMAPGGTGAPAVGDLKPPAHDYDSRPLGLQQPATSAVHPRDEHADVADVVQSAREGPRKPSA